MRSHPRPRGVTLVEALLGTAILGTLVVSMLVASSRLQTQSRRAQDCVDAAAAADELLERIVAAGTVPPPGQLDSLRTHNGWRYRMTLRAADPEQPPGGRVLALEVLPPIRSESDYDDTDAAPLVRVEVLLDDRNDATPTRTDTD